MWPLMWPGCCGRYSWQMSMAFSRSPDFRYSFASGAKYRRGFSSNFLRSSSIRAELAIESPRSVSGGLGAEARDKRKRIIHSADATRQSEVTSSLDFSPRWRLTLQASRESVSRAFFFLQPFGVRSVLQQMRGLAKYI